MPRIASGLNFAVAEIEIVEVHSTASVIFFLYSISYEPILSKAYPEIWSKCREVKKGSICHFNAPWEHLAVLNAQCV